MSESKREAVRELVEFRVDEVSLVDSPAIEEEFAIVKRDSKAIAKHIRAVDVDDETVTIVFGRSMKQEGESQEMMDSDKYHDDEEHKTEKAQTSAHETLVKERIEALRNLAGQISKADTLSIDALKDTTRKINSLVWKLNEDQEVLGALAKNSTEGADMLQAIEGIAHNVSKLNKAIGEETTDMSEEKTQELEKTESAEETTEEQVEQKSEKAHEPGHDDMKDHEPGHDSDEEEEEEGEAVESSEEEEEKAEKSKPKDQRKRFTRARIDKLMSAFTSLAEVMKDVNADSVDELLTLAETQKSETSPEGDAQEGAVEKSTEQEVEKSAEGGELAQRLESIEKALSKLNAAGIPKSLGSDGTQISKKADKSIWTDIVRF